MTRKNGNGPLLASGLIFGSIALIVVAAAAGNEAAAWVGGWFLLFFGLPLVTLALFLLIGGVAEKIRSKNPPPLLSAQRHVLSRFGGPAVLLCIGSFMVGYAIYFDFRPSEAASVGGSDTLAEGLGALVFNADFWVGIGLTIWGVRVFRLARIRCAV